MMKIKNPHLLRYLKKIIQERNAYRKECEILKTTLRAAIEENKRIQKRLDVVSFEFDWIGKEIAELARQARRRRKEMDTRTTDAQWIEKPFEKDQPT